MSRLIKTFFFIGDILLLNCSILLSSYLHYKSLAVLESGAITYLLIYSNLAWLFLVIISNPYHINKAWPIIKILKSQMAFLLIHLLVIASLNLFFGQNYGIAYLGLIYIIFMPLFFISKITIFSFRKTFLKDAHIKKYILIGKNEISYKLREYYMVNREEGRKFCGYVDYREGLLPIERIKSLCLTEDIHEIYCCIQGVQQEELNELVDFGLNSLIRVQLILPSNIDGDNLLQLAKYDKKPAISVATIPLDEVTNQIIKRVFDLIFSILVILFVLSWLTPIIGLLIVIDSPGPVFFLQWRNGKNNRLFRCFKFRTIPVSAEVESKLCPPNDPRITKLGNFLRETRIDEFPQFINVLQGSMSVVGPRPFPLMTIQGYTKLIQKFMGRHYVKPGVTGLAQCLGYRGDKTADMLKNLPDMETRVRMDFYYIEKWSFVLDIKIIFLTMVSLIREGGRL